MTKTEFRRTYTRARRTAMGLTLQAGRKIRREYIRVFSIVAKAVSESPNKIFLEERIKAAFPRKELYDFIRDTALQGRVQAVRLISDISKKHIFDLLDKIPGHGLNKDKISAMYEKKVERVKVANSKNDSPLFYNQRELFQTYSLSKSVWDTVNYAEESILNMARGGMNQGRDIRAVASDIMAYVKGGPSVIPGRWGVLEPGSREYARRLGRTGPDYRAIRVYRTEMYRNLQDEAILEGENNPACSGEYDWVRLGGREGDHCSVCQDNADGGPYTRDTIPAYPHPNCFCEIIPRLKDDDEFIKQLRDYANGEDTPGAREIEEWAQENGLMDEGVHYSKTHGEGEYIDSPNDDHDEREKLKEEMIIKGINADFNESSIKTIDYIPELHDKVKADFDRINEVLDKIEFTSNPSLLDEKKDEGSLYSEFFKKIVYNKMIFKSERNLRTYIDLESGWFASTELSGQIAHEYGHAIVNLLRSNKVDVITAIDNLLKMNNINSVDDRVREISGYAKFDTDNLIAEAVSDVLTMQSPREISLKIYNALKILYGGIK